MLTYTALREIQKKEMEGAALVPIGETFYTELAQLLKQKREEIKQSNALLALREYENIRKIAQIIQARREEKIVLLALRGELDGNGLSSEEKGLLERIARAVEETRTALHAVWGIEEQGALLKKVRIIRDVEKYTGLDSSVYGPFKVGQETVLPSEEAECLLKFHMAEQVL